MARDKVRPVHEIRMGRVRAAIWENDTSNGKRHNATLSRIYKDGYSWAPKRIALSAPDWSLEVDSGTRGSGQKMCLPRHHNDSSR